jgi:signal transduction histidine kinase/ActR/RegA family two-component response regulator
MAVCAVMTERRDRPAGAPLSRRLLLLACAGIVPLAIMSGIGLHLLGQQQRVQAERVGLELVRAIGTAVDAELRSTISVLESLATTFTLDGNDASAFRERARRVLDTQPQWAGVTLADASGARLVDTRLGADSQIPPISDRESFDRVIRTGAPVVGNLVKGADGGLQFPVRVPVLRKGQIRYVLTAVVKPEEIRDVVGRHGVPGDWVISVFDANGLRVARSRAHEESLGGAASPTLRALVAKHERAGFGETVTLEGERIYTPYSRIEPSGWLVALGIPTALVEAASYRSLAVYGGSILLSIGLGSLAALWVARSITRPIDELRSAAQALGRREAPKSPATSIPEIRDVAAALVAAAEERTSVEVDREALLRKEQEARATAEAADRAKDQFLAVLSHELRTPLNAVYGWARMLRAGQIQGEADVTRALEVIERNANAQVQLVDDLLDVSRVITGKMRLDVRKVDLSIVVEAAADAVRPAAEAKGIRLQSVLDPRAGPITGDPDRLQQIVWNLLINAVKFTPKGGQIQVHLQRINSHVEIVVSDSGQGIAPDVLPVIFERFRQADSSSTRTHSGLGLGLALVKHLVELHGGTVVAQSAGATRGATFVVRLPLTIAEFPLGPLPRVHPTAPSAAPLPAGTRLDGLKILVVDDDPDALELATAILESSGAGVRRCFAAPEALDTLREWRPDVLVSDIEMPGEDGYSLIRKVRALDPAQGGRTPAIALTAYGRTQDRILSLAAGYSMHVPKPVDPGELTTIVASVAARPPQVPSP